MKKKTLSFGVLLIFGICLGDNFAAMACDACKAQQPKFLQGITHGAGPTSNWDYVIVSIMVIITLYSLYALIKCLAKPTEKAHEEIKNIIFNS
ncbi:MAG: hypothetical protein ABIN91_01205 [Mucilaginibacter sp.]|jgi:hypothetical protein|uniref:hypothetical protein n=1 Tax=Mucilaginibacter sp. TaxID=1882438 RepID=UPI003267C5B7